MASTDRARRASVARLADASPDAGDRTPPDLTGKVQGSAFEWGDGIFLDAGTDERGGAFWDGSQFEVRSMQDMLSVDWKGRTLEAVLTLPLMRADWKLKAESGDKGAAERLEELLRRPSNHDGMTTPMRTVIGQTAAARLFRKSFFAKGFKLDTQADDGTVMYSAIRRRPASTCRLRLTEDGDFAGFEQDQQFIARHRQPGESTDPIKFEPKQSFVYVHGQHRDPLRGTSDIEIAYACWRTKQKVVMLWLNFLEAQALPRTIVHAKSGDVGKARKAARTIAGLRSSGVGVIDGDNMDINTLDVAGRGPQSFIEAIKYLDQSASNSVLAGFTDLTASAGSGRGSYALSKDQSDFFLQASEAVAAEMADAFTNFLVADLARYNYGDATAPVFMFDPLASVDQQPVLDLLKTLATAAQTTLPQEFVDELANEAARILRMDVGRIADAIKAGAAARQAVAAQTPAGASPVGQATAGIEGAVNTAHKIVKQATAA